MTRSEAYTRWMIQPMESFKNRRPNSARLMAQAQDCFPGGDTRTATFFEPYPVFIDRASGCKFWDVDGYEYLDFLNNYTALIHGHAYPAIVEAACKQIHKGTSYAAPTQSQHVLAELICGRVKSVQKLRFCNSGTEATMNAIRAARILTGRSKIVKMEGGYHGTHDLAEVSFDPAEKEAGLPHRPASVPENPGIPSSVLQEVIVVPFNNNEAAGKIIREHANEVACVIVEPMLGAAGCICPENGFLQFLRDITHQYKILLIFDEVVTFRLGYGGGQGVFEVDPDITAFGKIIGGGFPAGAFGGHSEIMKLFSPNERSFVAHSGTFNGNPVTMEAGIACLKAMTAAAFESINYLGGLLRNGISTAFRRIGIHGCATGMGSLGCIHFNAERIVDYRSVARGNFQAMALMHLRMLEKGINLPRRGGECSISTVMTDHEVRTFLAGFEEALGEIKPFLEENSPELLV